MMSCAEGHLLCWLEAHPGLAAWAQAVGTVAALAGAIVAAFLPIWSRNRELVGRQLNLKKAAVDTANMVVGCLLVVHHAAHNQTEAFARNAMPMKMFDSAERAINEFPFTQVDDLSVAQNVRLLLFQLQSARDFTDKLGKIVINGPIPEAILQAINERLLEAMEIQRSLIGSLPPRERPPITTAEEELAALRTADRS